jgi:hypothetical protein
MVVDRSISESVNNKPYIGNSTGFKINDDQDFVNNYRNNLVGKKVFG